MYELRRSSFGSSLIEIVLVLVLISAFLTCIAVFFVVSTFVKYPEQRKPLWITLAVCVALSICALLAYKLTAYDGSFALCGLGVAELLITTLVVDLKNRDTLMRENVNLIDEVLNASWWGSEDKPLQEQEIEPVAA